MHVSHDRNIYMLAGIAPAELFDREDRELAPSVRSFRPLSEGEAEDIHPNRIDFYTAREGDTWQSIAQQAGKGLVSALTLAIMNDHAIDEQPKPGDRLKIVVAGS